MTARRIRPPTKHDIAVAQLVAAGASTLRFTETVVAAIHGKHGSHEVKLSDENDPESEYVECERCLMKECIVEDRVIPDAFRVDAERQDVIVYEVEVTNPVTDEKLERYHRLWWVFDEEGWMLRLVVVDRFGNQHEVDLFESSTGGAGADPNHLAAVREYMGIRRPGESP